MSKESQIQEEEITLKDIYVIISTYYRECRNNWLLFPVFCLPFIIWQGYEVINTPNTYPATLTFIVNDEKGSGLSAISGVLGSIGLGGDSKNNYDRILALAKSTQIINQTLLTTAKIKGKEDILANHIIEEYHLREKDWKGPLLLYGGIKLNEFTFLRNDSSYFSLQEQAALKSLRVMVDEKLGFTTSLDKKSGIMSMKIQTISEDLSVQFLNILFERLSSFYISKTIEKNQATFNLVKAKVDSIQNVLAGTEYRQAKFEDQSKNLLLQQDKIPMQRYSRDKQLLFAMLAEAIKNQEVADFALKNSTPFIQSVDEPNLPLMIVKFSKLKALLKVVVLGTVVFVFFVSGRKFFVDSIK